MGTRASRRRRCLEVRWLPWLVALALPAGCQRVDDPRAALARFYANDGPECSLKAPLFDAAPGVVPLVVEAVGDPAMPKRRYAIGFLGEVGAQEAAAPLLAVLEDAGEQDYFRADALQALQAIDSGRANENARKHVGGPGLLGESARAIMSGKMVGVRRSAWERFRDRPCS